MIDIDKNFSDLMKSNIRPKCEPFIRVSGKDNNGNDIELVWRAKNIKDLTYKRGIDPVGRELPFMELSWKEIYTGKFNAQNYPEKYNNITKYMKVELYFVQDLSFSNSWKNLFDGGTTWRELFSQGISWKGLKNKVLQKSIKMPTLFLSARPTIDGQTITWVAKDLLSFINETQTIDFQGGIDVKLKNVISYFILDARSGFLESPDLFKAYTDMVNNLIQDENITEYIDKRIICDGNTNDIILNLASIYNRHFDFKDNIAVLKTFNPSSVVAKFDKKVLYSYPKIENSANISVYSFKNRIAEKDFQNSYDLEPSQVIQYDNYYLMRYLFDGYGEAYFDSGATSLENSRINVGTITEAYWVNATSDGAHTTKLYIVPIKHNAYNNSISIQSVGEPFNEDNPINPYDSRDLVAISRKDFLNGYFSGTLSNLSFEALANVALETGDVVEVETNLFDDNDNRITKKAMIVSIELNYNGSLKQKIKAHEVIL